MKSKERKTAFDLLYWEGATLEQVVKLNYLTLSPEAKEIYHDCLERLKIERQITITEELELKLLRTLKLKMESKSIFRTKTPINTLNSMKISNSQIHVNLTIN